MREALRHGVGGERLIARGPYVYLNRPFEQGPAVSKLAAESELGLHAALAAVFPFASIHRHQELALRSIKKGRHTVVATGTGSGKTEAFLLPLIDHCLHLRDAHADDGVTSVLVYPMNALADDQLRRLRPLLAGTRVTFGRYTGATPNEGEPEQGQLTESRAYTKDERELLAEGRDAEVALPWEECFSREDIRKRRPRLLLTNYSQLEYLLLRDKDLDLFRGAPLRFLVLDEVHTYTGALGSEVACLLRRLRHVAGKKPADMICVGTSATVQESGGKVDGRKATREFASRLFGVSQDDVELVTESYAPRTAPEGVPYTPPAPAEPRKLLDEILAAARDQQLQDEVSALPEALVVLTEKLCGHAAPGAGSSMARLHALLAPNQLVLTLGDLFAQPRLLTDALSALRALGRAERDDDDLLAEVLAYLTLGALVQDDGEPLLRPKLHYFLQGLRGLSAALANDGKLTLHFDPDAHEAEDGAKLFPLVLCRSCGQHYLRFVATESINEDGVGVRLTRSAVERIADLEDADENDKIVYVTNKLYGQEEEVEAAQGYLCRLCGALHDTKSGHCHNPKCQAEDSLVAVFVYDNGEMKSCHACGTAAKGYEEIVTPVRSGDVADVTILAGQHVGGHARGELAEAPRLHRQPPGRRLPSRLDGGAVAPVPTPPRALCDPRREARPDLVLRPARRPNRGSGRGARHPPSRDLEPRRE